MIDRPNQFQMITDTARRDFASLPVPPGDLRPPTLGELLERPLIELSRFQLGFVNLLCATGLPDTAELDLFGCLSTLEEWARLVQEETERVAPMFRRKPAAYENSEAYFRILVMITVLQRDIRVTYDANCLNSQRFESSREGFIHGVLNGSRTGTCANLPVLYTAIGRRLGYPIYLVHANGHLLCRWHSTKTGERFNIEASGKGLSTPSDNYYATRPGKEIQKIDVDSGLFLRNLNPAEELATFLATRGHCFLDRDYVLDAIIAYSQAHKYDPVNPQYMNWIMQAINKEMDLRQQKKLPGTYREGESEEFFNAPGVLPVTRYVLNDACRRIGGVNFDMSGPSRLAPSR